MSETDPYLHLTADQLRRRLAEAEETLRAIRDGDADALVIRAADEDMVFALAGGEESYRAIMEAMDIGAIALDADSQVLYANAALCHLLGCSAPALQRDGLFAQLDPVSAQVARRTIAQAGEGRHQTQFVQNHKGANRHLVITAAPLPLGFGLGCALTFTDVTARIEAAAARESERISRAVLTSANEAVVVCDRQGKIASANAAAAALALAEPVGRPFAEAFPFEFPIGGAMLHPDELLGIAGEGNAIKGLEASVPYRQPPRALLVSAAPLRLSGDEIGGSVITLVDVSERKDIEKRQTLLMHELDHRVKNTLAMVISICSRTAAGCEDIDDFRTRFVRRIQALAATHNLLTETAWTGLDLAAVVKAELAPYVASAGPRVIIRAMACVVPPNVGIAFGLVLHELATNAVKYGALSCESGTVTVTGAPIAPGRFEIVWRERGGPPVAPPRRHGFGQTLITRSLKSGEGTGADIAFEPEGVICRMVIPSAA
ncbi:MAG: PAS domain-containing protein [Sphingomonadales bacterium]|nr:PAS domain-containing protein [Sphingomonadales bacterium]